MSIAKPGALLALFSSSPPDLPQGRQAPFQIDPDGAQGDRVFLCNVFVSQAAKEKVRQHLSLRWFQFSQESPQPFCQLLVLDAHRIVRRNGFRKIAASLLFGLATLGLAGSSLDRVQLAQPADRPIVGDLGQKRFEFLAEPRPRTFSTSSSIDSMATSSTSLP